jgi:hypothetical protein
MIDLEKGERTIIGLETIQAKENEIRKDIQGTRALTSQAEVGLLTRSAKS